MLRSWRATFPPNLSSSTDYQIIREDQSAWRVVNSSSASESDVAAAYSATSRHLELRSDPGSIWGDFGRSNLARNVICIKDITAQCPYLISSSNGVDSGKDDIYCLPSLPWTFSASIGAVLADRGEQAGLVLYRNDGDWVKLVFEYMKDGKVWIVFGVSRGGEPSVISKVCAPIQLRDEGVSTIRASTQLRFTLDPLALSLSAEYLVEGDDKVPSTFTTLASIPLSRALAASSGSWKGYYPGLIAHGGPDGSRWSRFSDVGTDGVVRLPVPTPTKSTEGEGEQKELSNHKTLWNQLRFRSGRLEDISRVMEIENAGYPEDEAAAESSMALRLTKAKQYFLVVEAEAKDNTKSADTAKNWEIIGYVCGTACKGAHLHHDTMTQHDPEGETVCVHSVCIDSKWRGKGVASHALIHYITRLRLLKEMTTLATHQTTTETSIDNKERDSNLNTDVGTALRIDADQTVSSPFPAKRIVLLSKEHNIGLYVRVGFTNDGPSDVVHGADMWYQCSLQL